MAQQRAIRLALPETKEVVIRGHYAEVAKMFTQLSTASLVLPIIFLNKILGLGEGGGVVAALNGWFITSWTTLAVAIGAGLLFQWSQVGWIEVAVKGATEEQLSEGGWADRFKWFFMKHMEWLFACAMVGLFLGVITFAVGGGVAIHARLSAVHAPPAHGIP